MAKLEDGYYRGTVKFHDFGTMGQDSKDVFILEVEVFEGHTKEGQELHGKGQEVRKIYWIDTDNGLDKWTEEMEALGFPKGGDLSSLAGSFYEESPLKGIDLSVSIATNPKNEKYQNIYLKPYKKPLTPEEKQQASKAVTSRLAERLAERKRQQEELEKIGNDLPF